MRPSSCDSCIFTVMTALVKQHHLTAAGPDGNQSHSRAFSHTDLVPIIKGSANR